MALNRKRATSERLPPSTTISGTILDRQQLRRQLSQANGTASSESQSKDSRKVMFRGPEESETAAATTADIPSRAMLSASFSENTTYGTIFDGTSTTPPVTLRKASTLGRTVKGEGTGSLEAEVRLYDDGDGKVKGVLELSTLRQSHVPVIKVRVVCLIDVSGSMLLKGDKQQRRSKINILQTMAADIIDALEDEEDFFGVMTFGETSHVICPLERVTTPGRIQIKSKMKELDQCQGFSAVTDLSSALVDAVQMLATEQQDQRFLYRNCIIVFSDGEINAGHTDPRDLVHVTREKIRKYPLPEEMLTDLWVNISCVTTGSSFSQSLYLLSKLCGSDAYFYVDGNTDHPEADMLIPLMLRKTACAQMVSVGVQARSGAVLETHKCSQEYSVRRRRGQEGDRHHMAYFIHDMPTGIAKTFQLSLDVGRSLSADSELLVVDVQYVDSMGMLYNVSKRIRRQQILSLQADKAKVLEVMQKTAVNNLRQVLQNVGRNVAGMLESANNDSDYVKESVSVAIQAGRKEVQELLKQTLHDLTDSTLSEELKNFAGAIEANLAKLESTVKQHAAIGGKCWQYTKAMASAITRELPTVTNVLAQPQVVCPLPVPSQCASRRTQALSIYVFGGEEGESPLHDAARNVARSLADVLRTMEPSTL